MKECSEIFDAQSKTVHTNCLGLATEKRTYYISADTKEEITEWLEVSTVDGLMICRTLQILRHKVILTVFAPVSMSLHVLPQNLLDFMNP